MGSKGSKPRKPEHHLAKVGSETNDEWELHEKRRLAFGPGLIGAIVAIVIVVSLIGWLALI
jgi:hypothetical protein